jgi:cold shock CspA family protein/tetratricopeptide (TPR) repeat protein
MEALPENTGQDARTLGEQAQVLEQAGQFRNAALLYRQSYALQPTPFAASRAIHCLRQQGIRHAREAVEFARQALGQFPGDEGLVGEYVWAIFDGYLRSGADAAGAGEGATASADFQTKATAARRILETARDASLRRLTVFAICKEAGMRGRWELVLEFARCLDGEQLSAGAGGLQGQRRLSDQQRWLHLVTRAHLELGHYDECIAAALDATQRFPDDVFFWWWRALARVRGGSAEEGLRELLHVNRRFPPQWAIQRDIAETYGRMERHEDAWRWFCEAATAPGDIRDRLPMLTGMARLLEEMERWQMACDHLLLAWALAAGETGWETLADRHRRLAEEFRKRHAERKGAPLDPHDTPPDAAGLLTQCRAAWMETIKQALPHGTGYIRMFDAAKGIGFIETEDGTDVFFGLSTFKGQGVEPAVGIRVEFYLKEPYDERKNRGNLNAVHVFPAKPR